jgi:hypothetical protein
MYYVNSCDIVYVSKIYVVTLGRNLQRATMSDVNNSEI